MTPISSTAKQKEFGATALTGNTTYARCQIKPELQKEGRRYEADASRSQLLAGTYTDCRQGDGELN